MQNDTKLTDITDLPLYVICTFLTPLECRFLSFTCKHFINETRVTDALRDYRRKIGESWRSIDILISFINSISVFEYKLDDEELHILKQIIRSSRDMKYYGNYVFSLVCQMQDKRLMEYCIRCGYNHYDMMKNVIAEQTDYHDYIVRVKLVKSRVLVVYQRSTYYIAGVPRVEYSCGVGSARNGCVSIGESSDLGRNVKNCQVIGARSYVTDGSKNCIILGSNAMAWQDGQLVLGSATHPLDIISDPNGDNTGNQYIHVVVNGRRGRLPILFDT